MIYTVKKGDTLYKIAELFYGKGYLWRVIHWNKTNKKNIPDPKKLKTGQELYIPFR